MHTYIPTHVCTHIRTYIQHRSTYTYTYSIEAVYKLSSGDPPERAWPLVGLVRHPVRTSGCARVWSASVRTHVPVWVRVCARMRAYTCVCVHACMRACAFSGRVRACLHLRPLVCLCVFIVRAFVRPRVCVMGGSPRASSSSSRDCARARVCVCLCACVCVCVRVRV